MKKLKFILLITIASYCSNTYAVTNSEKATKIDQAFLMSELYFIGFTRRYPSSISLLLKEPAYNAEVVKCFKKAIKPSIESLTLERILSSLSQSELDEGYKLSSGDMYDSLNEYILSNRLELKKEYKERNLTQQYDHYLLEKSAQSKPEPLTDSERVQLVNLINWKQKINHKLKMAHLKEPIVPKGSFQFLSECKEG